MLSIYAQTTATIAIDTTTTSPVRPGFSGYNDEASTIEFWNYNFNTMANQMHPGWIRFPGGDSSEAFDWQTGQDPIAWINQFSPSTTAGSVLLEQMNWIAGKGGSKFIDAANRANLWGAQIVVCVNAYTDTPQSAGMMAAYAKANGIKVAAWELANEPYNATTFFSDATDYVTKMKPYRDAIKAADPNAVVAVFFDDPGRTTNPNPPWNKAMAAITDKWWDAVTYHFYPAVGTGAFANWMSDQNTVLATQTDAYINNYLAGLNPPGMLFLISEFNTSFGTGGSNQGLTTGTLWGAVFCTEFIMRMGKVPSLLLVGSHAVANDDGVDASNYHYTEVTADAQAGKPIDTTTLNYGYFFGAQGTGPAILNAVLKNASVSDKTTVTGGSTVPATGVANFPALYAQAYSTAGGALSVIVTNKSATAQQVTMQVNGSTPAGPFPLQYVTGTDPSVSNTSTNPSAVAIQTGSSANPVMIPPYSVVRADLVTPAVAALVHGASYRGSSLAPNQLVSAFGSSFAPQAVGASTQPLPTVLGGTTISITDSSGAVSLAPLDYVSPGQANFVLPAGLASGPATLKVVQNGATVLTGSFTVAAVAPGIFTANGNGAGVIAGEAASVAASGATTPLAMFACGTAAFSCLETPISVASPASTVYITLYGSGIRNAKSVQAYVAGVAVPVQYAGPQGSFAGLDQVNIALPASLAGTGETSLYLVADGQMSNVGSLKIQ
jgi:uncharacterized protein (TIGR03437 family)